MLRLKSLRQIYGYRKEDIADLLGVSKYTIRSYEQGKREPKIEQLITLARFFNCSVDHLIGNDDK